MQKPSVFSKISLTVLTLNSTLFGLSIDESKQLYPEQSTTVFVIYHPVARYQACLGGTE
ncbi:MAG: hypothetical protein MK111_24095 [Crocosphaera sp.]|uniref:hypothetical protein n=1 Tax=Crocosphaera sp. TaxID=2729996 RepID=UPI0025849C30|nr:hypothetical protein [Crocosphaera sp.]MCH2247674.1 hypothetical protein [Crocosphaera sp.]